MAKLFSLSKLFGKSTGGAMFGGNPQFFTETIKNKALREQVRKITFVRGSGYNNLVSDAFKVPLFDGAEQFKHHRLKLTRRDDGVSWDVAEITRFDLGADDTKNLNNKTDEKRLGTAKNLFDALRFCSEYEGEKAPYRQGKAGKDFDGVKNWRKAAADAGQVIDEKGIVVPCADGRVLIKGNPYGDDQEKILKLTRKPDPEEPGFFETLLSGMATAANTNAPAPAAPQPPAWQPPQRAPEIPYIDQNPVTAALRDLVEARKTHGEYSSQALAAQKRYDQLAEKMPRTQTEGGSINFLKWTSIGVGMLMLFNLLSSEPVEPNQVPDSQDLINAVQKNDVAKTAEILEAGVSPEAKGRNDRTALLEASSNGDIGTVRLLLEKGANIEAKDKYGQTALHWAAYNGYPEIVRLLLENGADANARSEDGWTSLHLAARDENAEIVRLLLEKDANPDIKNKGGWAALHFVAYYNGSLETTRLLLEKGATPDIKGRFGRTPLRLAKVNEYPDVVNLLREAMEKGTDASSSLASAMGKEEQASLSHAFTVTGNFCEIRGDVINLSAGRDASTYPLPSGCSLMPR